ncbi:hypothetical protein HDU67_009436 [Dinochytrium kinnereticum]|nr:hypothetical protein HDU67_009436 [Dinochytrium kinnereticum]
MKRLIHLDLLDSLDEEFDGAALGMPHYQDEDEEDSGAIEHGGEIGSNLLLNMRNESDMGLMQREKANALTKENFNLKLRIFFLEEKLDGRGATESSSLLTQYENKIRELTTRLREYDEDVRNLSTLNDEKDQEIERLQALLEEMEQREEYGNVVTAKTTESASQTAETAPWADLLKANDNVQKNAHDMSKDDLAAVQGLKDLAKNQAEEIDRLKNLSDDLQNALADELQKNESSPNFSPGPIIGEEEIKRLKELAQNQAEEIAMLRKAVQSSHNPGSLKADESRADSSKDNSTKKNIDNEGLSNSGPARNGPRIEGSASNSPVNSGTRSEEFSKAGLSKRAQSEGLEKNGLTSSGDGNEGHAKALKSEIAELERLLTGRENEILALNQLVDALEERNAELEAGQIAAQNRQRSQHPAPDSVRESFANGARSQDPDSTQSIGNEGSSMRAASPGNVNRRSVAATRSLRPSVAANNSSDHTLKPSAVASTNSDLPLRPSVAANHSPDFTLRPSVAVDHSPDFTPRAGVAVDRSPNLTSRQSVPADHSPAPYHTSRLSVTTNRSPDLTSGRNVAANHTFEYTSRQGEDVFLQTSDVFSSAPDDHAPANASSQHRAQNDANYISQAMRVSMLERENMQIRNDLDKKNQDIDELRRAGGVLQESQHRHDGAVAKSAYEALLEENDELREISRRKEADIIRLRHMIENNQNNARISLPHTDEFLSPSKKSHHSEPYSPPSTQGQNTDRTGSPLMVYRDSGRNTPVNFKKEAWTPYEDETLDFRSDQTPITLVEENERYSRLLAEYNAIEDKVFSLKNVRYTVVVNAYQFQHRSSPSPSRAFNTLHIEAITQTDNALNEALSPRIQIHSPNKGNENVSRLKKELADTRKDFKVAQESLKGVLAQEQSDSAKIRELEAQLRDCWKQISDFNSLSILASDEVQRLRGELEEQTHRLRVMESFWRKNKDDSGEESWWMDLIEEERSKWRLDISSFETRTRNLKDQIEGMETALAEKEMEIQRLKELLQHASAKIKDPKMKAELSRLKAENAILDKETNSLKETIAAIRSERDAATNAMSKMSADTSHVVEELLRKDQQIAQLQNSVDSVKHAHEMIEEQSFTMRKDFNSYLASLMKMVCKSLGISQTIPSDFEKLREELREVLSSALGIRELVVTKVNELDSRYSTDFSHILARVESESNCVIAFAEKVSVFKTKYRGLREKAEHLNSMVKTLKSRDRDYRAKIDQLEQRDRAAGAEIRLLEDKLQQFDVINKNQVQALAMNDAAVRSSEERTHSMQLKVQRLEEELKTTADNAIKDQRLASERVEELLEEQRRLTRQIDILEKHCNTLRDQRTQIKSQQMDPNDYEQALLTNEKLRSDFQEMRRVLEEKDSEMQQLRTQVSNITASLQHSKKKANAREDRYKRTILSAIDYLEHFNGKMSGMEKAISLLRWYLNIQQINMDTIDVCLDLMRRLSPQNVEANLSKLIDLAPDLSEDLLSAVDQPLKVQRCAETGRDYLLCDYNRDEKSYRSPWSNEYDPPLADGARPSLKLRKLEVLANDAFDTYRELQGVSEETKVTGSWDSIHVIEVQEKGRSSHYKLTSTIMLGLEQTHSKLGETSLAGSLTRQAEQDCPVEDFNTHIENIGRIVEDMENKMRNSLNEIYFGKTKDIVNDLRSIHSITEGKKQASIQSELVGKLMDRNR